MLVHLNNFIKNFFIIILITTIPNLVFSEEEKKINLMETEWSFKGIFGTFDRASLQRGYQVYTEVCAGCHSMQHLSYRN